VSSTKERILSAARELVEQGNGGTPNMSELARAVGISRQALYLHFPDRGSLLLALVADRLHPSWTAGEAATLLWELTSFRVWDDLVNESGLTADRYVEIVTVTALATLASPLND
jgi:AcrR family transcriptional regulator